MNTLVGAVSDDGLADAPAIENPPRDQTAPVLVDPQGRLGVRVCDAAGFTEGDLRYNERWEAKVNPAVLVDQLLVSDRPCLSQELMGYANGSNLTAFYYLGAYNSNVPIVANAIPVLEWPVDQNRGDWYIGWSEEFATGLVIALSTTQGKFTSPGAVMFAAVKVLRN